MNHNMIACSMSKGEVYAFLLVILMAIVLGFVAGSILMGVRKEVQR